ncbi:hypothetical protein B0H17DRAFT_1140114 [Mycena rosella]|uniref:Uncharacterized protein n=1 Tax=Mycena rosella TaxID=1033263 RepID=A0AAD7GCC4_MYCRO|nr:hypothetical protein B0H17DRAFT_1140114 [Mycena rosella]
MGDWELIRAVLASRDTDEQYQRVNTDCSSRFLLTSYHDIAQPRFVLWLCGRPLLTGNHDIVQPRFLMASNHIAQLSMQLLPDGIIDKPPSPSDKPGFFYEFLILEDDEDEDEETRRTDADVIKLGRAVHPLKRRRQWARQCRGQRQRWQFCWKVPFAAKFGAYPSYLFSSSLDQRAELLSHEHLKRTGAWLGPSTCSFCDVTHHKKFDFDRCGGMDGLIKVVEAYLRRLGWPVLSIVRALSSDDTAMYSAGLVTVSGEETKSRVPYVRGSDADEATSPVHPATPVKTKCWNGFYPLERGGSSRTWRLAAGQDALTCATHAETLATPRSVVRALLASAAANPLGFNFPITELFFEPLAPMACRRFKLERRKITPVQIFFALGPKAHSRRGLSLARTRAPHAETLVTARRVVRALLVAAAPTPSPITADPTKGDEDEAPQGQRQCAGVLASRQRQRAGVFVSRQRRRPGVGVARQRKDGAGYLGRQRGDEVGLPQGQRRGCVPSKVTYGRDDRPTMATSGHTSPPTKTTPGHSSSLTKATCGRVREPTKATSGVGVVQQRKDEARYLGRQRGDEVGPPQGQRRGCVPSKATYRRDDRPTMATSGRSSSDVRAYFSADKDDVRA